METPEQELENQQVASQSRVASPKPAIPDYEVLKAIGAGSFGQVWLVWHRPSRSHRAIKLLSKASGDCLERELTGLHNYIRIAQAYDGLLRIFGVSCLEDGRWCYAMELADDETNGQNIDPETYKPKTLASRVLSRERVPVADCIDLIGALADSLAHLHKRGLIHRDIKPSNIVFVRGQPKLADIGLVTDVDGTHSFAGTKGYTPPNDHSTKQADIYGLGKVLYEISTARDRNDYPGLPRNFSNAPDSLKFLELNEVIVKACQTNPALRYQTAAEMKADLALLQSGQSLRQLRTAQKRAAALKYALMAGVPFVLAGLAVYVPFYQQNIHRREITHQAIGRLVAEAGTAVNRGDMPAALLSLTKAMRLNGNDANNSFRVEAVLDQCPSLLWMWRSSRRFVTTEFSSDGQKIIAAELHGSARVWDLATGRQICRLNSKYHGLEDATLDREGKRAATAGDDSNARVWDIASGRATVLPHTGATANTGGVYSVQFSNNGEELLTSCRDGYAWVWDLATQQVKFRLGPHTKRLTWASYSSDNKYIATSSEDGTAQVWDVFTREPVGKRLTHAGWVYHVAFSPDASTVVTASFDKNARIWDFRSGRELILPHPAAVRTADFSPDGCHIITACVDGTVRIWDAQTGHPVLVNHTLHHGGAVMHAGFAPDARRVVTAGTDEFIRVWDLGGAAVPYTASATLHTSTGQPLVKRPVRSDSPPMPEGSGVLAGASENEQFLLYADGPSNQLRIRLWDTTSHSWGRSIDSGKVDAFYVSNDGHTIVATKNKSVEAFDYRTGVRRFAPIMHTNRVSEVVFNPDSSGFATVTRRNVQVFDCSTGKLLFAVTMKESLPTRYVAFNHGGDRLIICSSAVVYQRCSAQIWNVNTGRPVGKSLEHADGVRFAAFSRDDSLVVTCSEDFGVRVWSAETCEAITPRLLHSDRVLHAAFAPNSKWLATVCEDRSMRVWDISSGTFITPPMRSLDAVRRLAFWSDDTVTAASKNGEAASWRVASMSGRVETLESIANVLTGSLPDLKAGGADLTRLGLPEPSAEEIRIWHWEMVSNCERSRNWPGALFHLDILEDLGAAAQKLLDRRRPLLEKLNPAVTSN